MFNKTAPKSLKDTFEADVFDWFSRTRAGHMEQYQYLEPTYANDPVRGSKLWNAWEAVAPEDNMLKRQGQIIEEQLQDMVAMTKPRRTLVDLGTGGLNAFIRNTIPFITAYEDDLDRIISVDVSKEAAHSPDVHLQSSHPELKFYGVQDDFLRSGLSLPLNGRTVVLFMGGTIGNIEADQKAPNPLELMAARIGQLKQNFPAGTVVFIGLEATQSEKILYGDYDHPAHAEFEINIMHGIKRDVLPDEDGFDPGGWKYAMKWWPESHQFCHLAEATCAQTFSMRGRDFVFEKGDQLVIDNSFKFPVLAMQRSAQMAGTRYIKPFADKDGRMVIHGLEL